MLTRRTAPSSGEEEGREKKRGTEEGGDGGNGGEGRKGEKGNRGRRGKRGRTGKGTREMDEELGLGL